MSDIVIYNPEEIIEPLPDINLTFDDDFDSLEESVILKKGKIKISVDGPGQTDNGFKSKPYFKVYTGNNFSSTSPKERARIAINDVQYVDHPSAPANWKLNSSEKKQLMEILNHKI